MTRPFKFSFLLMAVTLLLPLQSSPQKQVAAPAYPDTENGLQKLLEASLESARAGDDNALAPIVTGMEIPDFEKWVVTTFGAEASKVWEDPDGTRHALNVKSHQELLTELAHEDGQIVVHKLKDEPKRDGSFVSGNLACLDKPLDIYRVGWRAAGESDRSDGGLVGYFVFIDGTFRWGSGINYANGRCIEGPQPESIPTGQESSSSVPVPEAGDADAPFIAGVGGVGQPSCMRCPNPTYTPEARKLRIEGVVSLIVTIDTDGRATDVKVRESLGAELDKTAINTVRSWQFQPALGPNGKPVAVVTAVEITFLLL